MAASSRKALWVGAGIAHSHVQWDLPIETVDRPRVDALYGLQSGQDSTLATDHLAWRSVMTGA